MTLRKNTTWAKTSISIEIPERRGLSLDECNRATAFVNLLIAIDKRKRIVKRKTKKKSKVANSKGARKLCGPLFLFITNLFLTPTYVH